jgi:sugar lactone lactonase YvrE
MAEPRVVLDGLVMGESIRWHAGRVWFCDWGAGEIIRVEGDKPEVVQRMAEGPFCIDWLPGGELLILDGPGARLLRDGSVFADLGHIDRAHPWNDIVADSRGNVFVNNIGYAFGVEEPAPGLLAVVTPDGRARQVADELLFPNGMAVTADDATLIVAESHGGRLTALPRCRGRHLVCRRAQPAVRPGPRGRRGPGDRPRRSRRLRLRPRRPRHPVRRDGRLHRPVHRPHRPTRRRGGRARPVRGGCGERPGGGQPPGPTG